MPYRLDTDTQVFFYEDEFYCLSNFSPFRLYWRGLDFDTSEHAYHWEKFVHTSQLAPTHITCDRCDLQQQILRARSAHAAFKLAESHAIPKQPQWDNHRVAVMRHILLAKEQQHEYVRRKLLETGTRELIENSWRDSFWGWGEDGTGQNMMGKLWMEIRAELQAAA